MAKKLTHEEYVTKLKNNNELTVLEKYQGSATHILHRCKCGIEWKIEPERASKPGTVCRNGKSKIDEILDIVMVQTVEEAFKKEQSIIQYNKEYLYRGANVLSDGNTELFVKDILDGKTITQYLKEIYETS